jgi:hypothetical protein
VPKTSCLTCTYIICRHWAATGERVQLKERSEAEEVLSNRGMPSNPVIVLKLTKDEEKLYSFVETTLLKWAHLNIRGIAYIISLDEAFEYRTVLPRLVCCQEGLFSLGSSTSRGSQGCLINSSLLSHCSRPRWRAT